MDPIFARRQPPPSATLRGDDGRQVPDAGREGRRLQSRPFLRRRSGGAQARRPHVGRRYRPPAARRPRFPQASRRLQRGAKHQGPSDGDPGQDQEGLRHGRRGRIAHDGASSQEAGHRRPAGVPRPVLAAADQRAGRAAGVLPAGGGFGRADLSAQPALRARRLSSAAAAPGRPGRRSGAGKLRRFRAEGGRQGHVDHGRGRPPVQQPSQEQGFRLAGRADRGRRGADLRHGQPVPSGRHLLARGPALRAGGCRLDALLQGGGRRAASRGGHHRGRRDLVVGGCRDVLQRPRKAAASVLHLLFDVRLPADRRPDLGRRRPAFARLPIGATAGRTTLGGEGFSTRTAAAISSRRPCRTAVPTTPVTPYEMAVIVDHGARRMLEQGQDEFITPPP